MKFNLFLFLFFFSFIGIVAAQEPEMERKVVEFTGTLISDSESRVPFAHIRVKGTGRGTVADYWGQFYLPVYEGDTILFSSIGYQKSFHIIPYGLDYHIYRTKVTLNLDTIMLSEMVVLPWTNYEQLKEIFISMSVPEEHYQQAVANFKMLVQQAKTDPMLMGSAGNYRYFMGQIADQKYTAGQYPVNNLLNPLAWAQFFQALKNGDISLKNDD